MNWNEAIWAAQHLFNVFCQLFVMQMVIAGLDVWAGFMAAALFTPVVLLEISIFAVSFARMFKKNGGGR